MSVFKTSRELPASPAEVFAAISDSERLARWWGPAGFSNTFEVCEFKPGGRWKFTMHGPGGNNYPNESCFTRIVPDAELVIRHLCEPLFELSITLSATASGTLVTWVQDFDVPEVAAAIRHIVEPGNEQNLDRLAAEVRAAQS